MDLKWFPVYFLLCLCLQMDMCPAIKVTITPKTFSKDKGSTVDVTCNLDSGEGDARDIVLIKIARKGERAIVLLHQNNSISYSAGNANEFPATGNLKGAVSSSSLQMTITTPDPEDSGAYTCSVYYINAVGVLKEHKDNEYLTVEDPAVKEMNKTVTKLEDVLEQRKRDIEDLKKKDADDSTKLVDLEGKFNKQAKNIQDLVQKDTDVDKKLKDVEQRTKDQIKDFTDKIKDTTYSAKIVQLENTILHQAANIRDLTDKLSDFEKKLQRLVDNMKAKADKQTSDSADEKIDNDIANLKETVELHSKNIKDLKETTSQNGDGVENLKGILKVVTAKSEDNKDKASDFEKKLSTFKDETNGKIDVLNTVKEDDLGSQLTNLQNLVKGHTDKIKEVTNKAKEVTEMTKEVKGVTDTLAQQIKDSIKQSSTTKDLVGFHVTSGLNSMYPVKDQAIRFNEMTLNEGSDFDLKRGIFTAPKAGLYAFMLYLYIPCYDCKLEATIMADGKIMSRFTGGNRYDFDQHSINTVVKLDKGVKVKAYVTWVNKNQAKKDWTLGTSRKCGFSGVLVAASS